MVLYYTCINIFKIFLYIINFYFLLCNHVVFLHKLSVGILMHTLAEVNMVAVRRAYDRITDDAQLIV
jgi:hypothetical protein